jgi:hypothetical protein
LELLVLAKQQMKLIEYLTEHHARAHAWAAALLGVTEKKTFHKELTLFV